MKVAIKIGTRGSNLALWQANWVKSALMEHHLGLSAEVIPIKTTGDKVLDVPLSRVGGSGLFIKEIETVLANGRIDLAVHSMKDMPAQLHTGLCIGAVPHREIANDALVSKNRIPLSGLPLGAQIGTSSLRRASQLLHLRPDFRILPLRGNLETRIKKLSAGELDAVVLAAAGMKRLNLENDITETIDINTLIPAVGQGALCVEIRTNDPDIQEIVSVLDHPESRAVITCERAFLARLEGGCQVPLAAYAGIRDKTLTISGMVAELDGSTLYKETLLGPALDPASIGTALADKLIRMGAKEILTKLTPQGTPS